MKSWVECLIMIYNMEPKGIDGTPWQFIKYMFWMGVFWVAWLFIWR